MRADSLPQNIVPSQAAPLQRVGKVFHMRRDSDDRMAGSIPVWEAPRTAQQSIERNLAGAAAPAADFAATLAYIDSAQTHQESGVNETPEEFGFGDIIDMVNPLHHIPLVSTVYRAVTGDEIKPASRIIGGAVFGGVAGAAAGIANVIIEEETGRDIAGNVIALAAGESGFSSSQQKSPPEEPEKRLELASRALHDRIDVETLPPLAIGIMDPGKAAQSYRATQERTAGNDLAKRLINHSEKKIEPDVSVSRAWHLGPREPITQLILPPLPSEK